MHGVLENVETVLIEWADHFLVAFQNVRLPKPPCSSLPSSEWVPPPSTHVKMNFNVGFMEKDRYQIAFVARNSDGCCLWWRVARSTSHPLVEVSEARAALDGVQIAVTKGWRNLIAEGDNSQVISAVQNQLEEPQLSYDALVSKILFFFFLFSSTF